MHLTKVTLILLLFEYVSWFCTSMGLNLTVYRFRKELCLTAKCQNSTHKAIKYLWYCLYWFYCILR